MSLVSYEWRRARSIRTTWITGAFALLSVVAFAYLSTVATEGAEVPVTEALSFSARNPVALVLVASLGAMAFGHEYRYGTIRLTLTAFPKRPGVYFVKLLYTLVLPLVAVAGGVALGLVVLRGLGASEPVDWLQLVWEVSVATATVAAMAFALTLISRSHPLGIIGPVLLSIVETVLIGLLSERFDWLPKVLPFQAMSNWFGGGPDAALGAAVWAAWMAGLLVLGFLMLVRRDA